MAHKEPDFCRYRDCAAWYVGTPKWIMANMLRDCLMARNPTGDWLAEAQALSKCTIKRGATIPQNAAHNFAKERREKPKLRLAEGGGARAGSR